MTNNNIEVIYKQCTVCKKEKLANSEFFHKQNTGKHGLRGICKVCKSKQSKKYTKDNKKELIQKWRTYNNENREKINKRNKEFYWSNNAKVKEQRKLTRKRKTVAKRELDAVVMRTYYIKNQEKLRERAKDYKKTEKGRQNERLSGQRRRSRVKKLPYTLTIEQWEECKTFFGNSCCYCGQKETDLHQEHFYPLSKGGGYTKDNILPSCKRCNVRKNAKLFKKWYPSFEFYDEEREKKIINYLDYDNKCL